MVIFWRLLGFLRPYKRGVIWSFVLAGGALGGTVVIPYLTGVAINAIRAHHHHDLMLLVLAILAAGLVRLVLSVFRRLIAGQVSLGVELDLREALYNRLQQLELAFFDRQQTGQLMSRATVDLQSVRFFLGYGLIFIAQSLVTILLAGVAMFLLQPKLAAISLAPVPFVILIANRYGHKSQPAMREAQQRIAELTADTEENVSGVRVVKAFAQEQRQLAGFETSTQRVFEQQVYATRIQALYTPLISFLPNLGLAAILLFGGREVINGSLSVGAFTAFYAYLLMLISPMRTLGYMLGSAQRSTASGARIFQILDQEPQIVSPPGAPPLPAGRGHVVLQGAGLTFEGTTAPALSDIDLDVPAGQTIALVGAMGSGKSALVQLLPAPVRRHHRLGLDRRRRRALGAAGLSLRQRTGGRHRRPVPVLGHRARQHRLRPRERHPRGGGARRRGRAGRRVHRAAAQGLRHDDRRARTDPVRRTAPADRDRPGDPRRAADPRAGRRHLLGRRLHRI